MQIDCFNDLNKQVKISSQTQNAYLENKLLYFENYAKNFQKNKQTSKFKQYPENYQCNLRL